MAGDKEWLRIKIPKVSGDKEWPNFLIVFLLSKN
jgi:hypothetical protein